MKRAFLCLGMIFHVRFTYEKAEREASRYLVKLDPLEIIFHFSFTNLPIDLARQEGEKWEREKEVSRIKVIIYGRVVTRITRKSYHSLRNDILDYLIWVVFSHFQIRWPGSALLLPVPTSPLVGSQTRYEPMVRPSHHGCHSHQLYHAR